MNIIFHLVENEIINHSILTHERLLTFSMDKYFRALILYIRRTSNEETEMGRGLSLEAVFMDMIISASVQSIEKSLISRRSTSLARKR